jgi:imidazolonepropionase-like amidohydrolase
MKDLSPSRRRVRGLVPALALALLTTAGCADDVAQAAAALSPEVLEYVSVPEAVVALTNVTVVDGTGAEPVEGRTILIRDGRIAEVGASGEVSVPGGARVLDLAGHTVIPGIYGLHNHTFYSVGGRRVQLQYTSPRLYLGTGVTSIRTTGAASPYEEIELKRQIDAGVEPGPRMHVTGPYLSGPGAPAHHLNLTAEEEAREVIGYWAEEGATWFKAYTQISSEALGAAIDEAHRRGLKFTGHLCSVSFIEAVELGIDNLEHGFFTNTDYHPDKEPSQCPGGLRGHLIQTEIDSDAVRETFRVMIENDVAMTSTLAVYELSYPGRPPLEDRFREAMDPESFDTYMATRERILENAESSTMPEVFHKAQEFEVAFVRAGGLLGAGVDPTGNGGALPGFGDQRNYELLLEAGFTPVEAIQIMTLNGARIMGEDDILGSIEEGKLADLVIIRGDPIGNPAEIRNVVTVFKDGVGYDAGRLIEAVRGQVGVR